MVVAVGDDDVHRIMPSKSLFTEMERSQGVNFYLSFFDMVE
jgi:hypothetical protein